MIWYISKEILSNILKKQEFCLHVIKSEKTMLPRLKNKSIHYYTEKVFDKLNN